MAMSKHVLRWWLIGYCSGDSTLETYGLRTSSATPAIAKRLSRILGRPSWIRGPDRYNRRKLYVFKVTDPEIVDVVLKMKRGVAPERMGSIRASGWLAGYLDADGYVHYRGQNFTSAYLFSIDWRIIRLIAKLCEKLGLDYRVGLQSTKGRSLRKHPIFRVYVRPVDDLPSVKVHDNI